MPTKPKWSRTQSLPRRTPFNHRQPTAAPGSTGYLQPTEGPPSGRTSPASSRSASCSPVHHRCQVLLLRDV
ncbi:hypothetical protein SRHO_G00246430 [Serrasalmus rhombeus]